jgi:hypothetical protein
MAELLADAEGETGMSVEVGEKEVTGTMVLRKRQHFEKRILAKYVGCCQESSMGKRLINTSWIRQQHPTEGC